MRAQLILKYEFSRTDDFGWLEMSLQTPTFSGRGGFWVQWQDVQEWTPSLLAYPLSAPTERDWGYGEPNGEYRSVIRIAVAPANATGDLEVCASVSDRLEPRNRCDVVFRTNYPDLETFAKDLAGVMNSTCEEAVLNGRVSG